MKKFLPIAYIFLVIFIFFWPFFSKRLLPIPADNIIGLYNPFIDYYRGVYPRGFPYKNYLLTDPVKTQYPWRNLAINMEKKLQIPIWNPYSFSGTPLLANISSAVFYPGNIVFFLLSFPLGWSLLILLQPVLAGIFLYLYLRNLKLSPLPCMLGALAFAFSGFSVAWMEWGTIVQTALWLPLILLSIDNTFEYLKKSRLKKVFLWNIIFIFATISSFLAGFLQIFFYVFLISVLYFLLRFIRNRNRKTLYCLLLDFGIVILLIAVQLIPTIRFISLSGRSLDQANWGNNPGWFVPWKHLVQFFSPDFFGNPATLNYWGTFNYGEFIGYIGILPLLMAFVAILYGRSAVIVRFFTFLVLCAMIFALPTGISRIPFLLKIPYLSTSQPTRLLFIVDFGLAVLAAYGLEYFLNHKKKILYPILIFTLIFSIIWIVIIMGLNSSHMLIARKNTILPTGLFIVISIVLLLLTYPYLQNITRTKFLFGRRNSFIVFLMLMISLTALELTRFNLKFNPFTPQSFLYPQTKTISFLQKNLGLSRIMTDDSPTFPPDFSVMYKIQSVDGYDSLYLLRYAEFVTALERNKPDISPPFPFSRIIIPHNIDSKLADFLGVKYFIARSKSRSTKIIKVFSEGKTIVYNNPFAFSRAFFVNTTECFSGKEMVIKKMFSPQTDLRQRAFLEEKDGCLNLPTNWSEGKVTKINYSENNISVETENPGEGFLVFVDSYYPTWKAKIYNHNTNITQEAKILLTDFAFRGIAVPKGKNTITFSANLF
jgi:hypothetical protein